MKLVLENYTTIENLEREALATQHNLEAVACCL